MFIDSDLEEQYGEQLYQEHLEYENNQMKKDITTMNEEIERLNNIINELEKYADNLWLDNKGIVLRFREKIQILKGSDTNE